MTSTTLMRDIAAEETLERTLGQFVGSWVALRDHEVVADARTLNALLDKIEGTPVDGVLQISSGHSFLNESLGGDGEVGAFRRPDRRGHPRVSNIRRRSPRLANSPVLP
jgi:hypothetical protein